MRGSISPTVRSRPEPRSRARCLTYWDTQAPLSEDFYIDLPKLTLTSSYYSRTIFYFSCIPVSFYISTNKFTLCSREIEFLSPACNNAMFPGPSPECSCFSGPTQYMHSNVPSLWALHSFLYCLPTSFGFSSSLRASLDFLQASKGQRAANLHCFPDSLAGYKILCHRECYVNKHSLIQLGILSPTHHCGPAPSGSSPVHMFWLLLS